MFIPQESVGDRQPESSDAAVSQARATQVVTVESYQVEYWKPGAANQQARDARCCHCPAQDDHIITKILSSVVAPLCTEITKTFRGEPPYLSATPGLFPECCSMVFSPSQDKKLDPSIEGSPG